MTTTTYFETTPSEEVDRRGLRTTIGDRDLDEDVFRAALRVLHEDVEVAVLVEHAGFMQLEFRLVESSPFVGLCQLLVREARLRVLLQKLHVRVGWRGVEVEVVLLDVLPVIPLRPGQAEEALLDHRIAPVPQAEGEADPLVAIADAGEAVLVPAVGAGAGLFVGEDQFQASPLAL